MGDILCNSKALADFYVEFNHVARFKAPVAGLSADGRRTEREIALIVAPNSGFSGIWIAPQNYADHISTPG